METVDSSSEAPNSVTGVKMSIRLFILTLVPFFIFFIIFFRGGYPQSPPAVRLLTQDPRPARPIPSLGPRPLHHESPVSAPHPGSGDTRAQPCHQSWKQENRDREMCALFGLDLVSHFQSNRFMIFMCLFQARPPPVPLTRPYTVDCLSSIQGYEKLITRYSYKTALKQDFVNLIYPEKAGGCEVLLRQGENIVVLGASTKRRHLVVEKNNLTINVPHHYLELKGGS